MKESVNLINLYSKNAQFTGYWLRTCQECGTTDHYKWPQQNGIGDQTDAFCEAKCRHCKSEGSLDMGCAELTEAAQKASLDELDKE